MLSKNGVNQVLGQLFEHEFTRAGKYSLVKLEFNSVEAIKQCVIAGLGIGFLPQVAVSKELEGEKLCAIRWERPFKVNTQMIYNREKWHSPRPASLSANLPGNANNVTHMTFPDGRCHTVPLSLRVDGVASVLRP